MISMLAGIADNFPIHQWDMIVLEVKLTLNHLQEYNVAPNMTAYMYHYCQFDSNQILLAPMWCVVQFYNKPNRWWSWVEPSSNGWYLGTSGEHYQCHRVFVKTARSIRVSDTVFFKHKYLMQPTVMPEDVIVKAYQDLIKAIQGIPNTKGITHMEALTRIEDALVLQNQHPIIKVTVKLMAAACPRVQCQPKAPEIVMYGPDPRVPL